MTIQASASAIEVRLMNRFVLTMFSATLLTTASVIAQSQPTTATAPQYPLPAPAPSPTPAAAGQRGRAGSAPRPAITTSQATTAQTPAAAAPVTPRKLPSQNVRVDVTITDTMGTGSAKKTVT